MKKLLLLLPLLFLTTPNLSFSTEIITTELVACSGCQSGAGSCYNDSNRRKGRVCTGPSDDICPGGFTACTKEVVTPCGEEGNNPQCTVGTIHDAGHTLNIHMGGFQDGLYVCKVEVTGHLCDLDDANVDADVLTDAQGNLLGDGKSYTFPKPAMTSNGTTDNQSSELHLNSFRFGSMYRVTYCYDYRRATSRRVTNQEGLLTGSMAANTALDDYAAIAGVSATLDWSCSDTLGTVAAAAAPVTYNALDNSANNTLDVLAIFPDLGISQTGSCVFTVDFVEDGNVGAIRPVHATNSDGITHGTIDTDVNLSMDLIQN